MGFASAWGGGRTASPQLMTDVAGVYQYGVFTNSVDLSLWATRRRISTGVIQMFNLARVPALPAGGTHDTRTNKPADVAHAAGTPPQNRSPLYIISKTGTPDTHFELVVGVDGNDVVHITGNYHHSQSYYYGLHYVRCLNVADFTNPASWTAEQAGNVNDPFKSLAGAQYWSTESTTSADHADPVMSPGGVGPGDVYTYNYMERLANGRLVWFTEQFGHAAGNNLRHILAHFWDPAAPAPSGLTHAGQWRPLVNNASHDVTRTINPATGGHFQRSYFDGLWAEPSGRLWAYGIWNVESNYSYAWVMYSDDADTINGTSTFPTWKNVHGTTVTLPITEANIFTNNVYVTSGPQGWLSNGSIPAGKPTPPAGTNYTSQTAAVGITIDGFGHPHIAISGDPVDENPYYEHYWNGTTWVTRTVADVHAKMYYVGGELCILMHDLSTYTSSDGGSRNLILKRPSGAKVVLDRVVSFMPNADPVRLRSGVFSVPAPTDTTYAVSEYTPAAAPPAPTAAFSTVISGMTVTVTDTSTGAPTRWFWDFENDGATDSENQVPGAHTYATAGVKTIRLTVSNAGGSTTVTHNVTAVITAAVPVANFTSIANGLSVSFTDTSLNTPTSWAWDFTNDGITDSTARNPTRTFPQAGNYPVRLRATNASGTGTVTKTVVVTVTSDNDMCSPRTSGRNMGPQLMTDVADEFQYGTFYDGDGFGFAFKRDLATGSIIDTIDLVTIAGNPLGFPLLTTVMPSGLRQVDDDHFGLSVGVDSANVVHITGNSHDSDNNSPENTGMHYITCDDVDNFGDPASWTHAGNPDEFIQTATNRAATSIISSLNNGAPIPVSPLQNRGQVYTYNYYFRDSSEQLYWVFSQMDHPSTDLDRDWLVLKRVAGAWVALVGTTPTTRGEIVKSQAVWDGLTANRVYIFGWAAQERPGFNDRIWLWGLWRQYGGGTNPVTGTGSGVDPWCIYSDDAQTCAAGASTWHAADGTPVTTPITWQNRAAASVELLANTVPFVDPPHQYVTVANGMEFDDNGNPFFNVKEGYLGAISQFYFDGTNWQCRRGWGADGIWAAPHKLRGEVWYRKLLLNGVGAAPYGRTGLVHEASGQHVYLGRPVKSFYSNPDPVRLKRHHIYSTVMGDAHTPEVWEFGFGALGKSSGTSAPTPEPPSFVTPPSSTTVTAVRNAAMSYNLVTDGSPVAALTSTALPAGLTLIDNGNGTGRITGTPTTSGTTVCTVTATNTINDIVQTATVVITLTITTPGVSSTLPGTIDKTGVTDVSAAMQSYIDSVPNGSTIIFPTNGIFLCNTPIYITAKSNLTILGNNSQFTLSTHNYGAWPNVIDAQCQKRCQWWIRDCTNIVIRGMRWLGMQPFDGLDKTTPNFLNAAALRAHGPILIDTVRVEKGSSSAGTWNRYIREDAGSWITDGIEENTYIRIDGFNNVANDGPYITRKVTAKEIWLVDHQGFVNEPAGAMVQFRATTLPPGAHITGAYIEEMEFQHCVRIESCDGVEIDTCLAQRPYGDGYYIGQHNDIMSRNIWIHHSRVEHCGRQGYACVSGENIQIDNCTSYHVRRTVFDIEPTLPTVGWSWRNIHWLGNRSDGNGLSYVVCQTPGGQFNDTLVVRDNLREGNGEFSVYFGGDNPANWPNIPHRHTKMWLINNEDIETTAFPIRIVASDGVVVRNNIIPLQIRGDTNGLVQIIRSSAVSVHDNDMDGGSPEATYLDYTAGTPISENPPAPPFPYTPPAWA